MNPGILAPCRLGFMPCGVWGLDWRRPQPAGDVRFPGGHTVVNYVVARGCAPFFWSTWIKIHAKLGMRLGMFWRWFAGGIEGVV